MANHKSAIKRIKQNEVSKQRNKLIHKTTRNVLKNLKATTDKKEAFEALPKATSLLDKLVKKNIIHKNKAANLKSKLAKNINNLA